MLKSLGICVLVCLVCYCVNWFLTEQIEDAVVHLINLCGIAILLAVSLNVINGLAGQFSLGHAGFMSVGAYVSAYFTTNLSYFDQKAGQYVSETAMLSGTHGFLFSALAGAGAAALIGLLVGAPTLRLKGDYLAIVTLGVGEIIQIAITDMKKVGGATGLSGIPGLPSLPFIPEGIGTTAPFWIFSTVGLAIIACIRLQNSTYGRVLVAIRENELAAELMGIRAVRLKVMAFVFGAFIAGLAGAIYARYQLSVRPADFSYVRSIEVVVMIVLGGLGSLSGAVIGAVTMTLLPEVLRPVEEGLGVTGIRMIVYSLVLILLMLFRPQGLFGQRELSLKLLRRFLPGSRKGDT